jgi:hypothetical protein
VYATTVARSRKGTGLRNRKQRADTRIFPASFDHLTVTQTPEPNLALLLGAGELLLAIFDMFYKRQRGSQETGAPRGSARLIYLACTGVAA